MGFIFHWAVLKQVKIAMQFLQMGKISKYFLHVKLIKTRRHDISSEFIILFLLFNIGNGSQRIDEYCLST